MRTKKERVDPAVQKRCMVAYLAAMSKQAEAERHKIEQQARLDAEKKKLLLASEEFNATRTALKKLGITVQNADAASFDQIVAIRDKVVLVILLSFRGIITDEHEIACFLDDGRQLITLSPVQLKKVATLFADKLRPGTFCYLAKYMPVDVKRQALPTFIHEIFSVPNFESWMLDCKADGQFECRFILSGKQGYLSYGPIAKDEVLDFWQEHLPSATNWDEIKTTIPEVKVGRRFKM